MNICFISMTNMFLCPYIKKYISCIDGEKKIDLIYWNRHQISENLSEFNKSYSFNLKINENSNFFQKIIGIIKFKKFCINVIKKNKYEKLIFLHNYIPILMCCFLRKKYRNNYIIDIRDYSFENNSVFYWLEKKVIQNSGLAVISSEGYKEFLPKYQYILCHNDPQINEMEISKLRNRKCKKDKPIQISFIGLVRFYEQNKKLLDTFGNDQRFVLAYYGQNSERLEKYASERGITNVIFKGRFDAEETVNFYENTDIINNYYGNNTPVLEYALSNKLYYAATFYIPILVCTNTYMEKMARKNAFAIELEENKQNCVEEFYDTYINLDRKKLKEGCDNFLSQVKKDNSIFRNELNKFLNDGRE